MEVTVGAIAGRVAEGCRRIIVDNLYLVSTVPAISELKTKYLALQQDADFALWRAREANGEMRRRYQCHLVGEGDAPSLAQLEELRLLEQDAEARYRELRAFLREHFEQLAVVA